MIFHNTVKPPAGANLPGALLCLAGRATATEPAQIMLFTLLLGRFTQVCFQNPVKCGIIKIL
ncbi:MAG: hypothetical protein BHV90_17320 [Clostridiales bacterium 42_27]|nr:MAG: hypothetical protein BHV90_17320 [Clostridiales bacterium 42_27]